MAIDLDKVLALVEFPALARFLLTYGRKKNQNTKGTIQ